MASDDVVDPLAILSAGVDSYRPYLAASGELNDPVFQVPTQYGTPCHAWGNAVLAVHGDPARRADRTDAAVRGLLAALKHVADVDLPATWSGFDRPTISASRADSHRDFFWPMIMKTYQLLIRHDADPSRLDTARTMIESIDPEVAFLTRPPSNWSMVWLSGEWLRMHEGISPTKLDQMDDWLQTFIDESFDLKLGLFIERGLPNAYDLFTRAHLADLLRHDYQGRHRETLLEFLAAGLRRSLAMQLSDGSLASGYRSTGQTWTLGAQIAFFTYALELGLGTDADQAAAQQAISRTMISFAQWQRPEPDPYSPVQNLLPGWRRGGYEEYTADGHYASLALAFLASAITAGLPKAVAHPALDQRAQLVHIESEPTQRATAHRGRISIAVQARADHVYDGNGLVDITFGAGRYLHLVSSARHLAGGPWLNPGIAYSPAPGRVRTIPFSRLEHMPHWVTPSATGLAVRSTLQPTAADHPLTGWAYQQSVTLTDDGIEVIEQTPGQMHYPVLLLPYPSDLGAGLITQVSWTDTGARLELDSPIGPEWLELQLDAPIAARLDVNADYANRRGMCGLIRLDLAQPTDQVKWSLTSGVGQ